MPNVVDPVERLRKRRAEPLRLAETPLVSVALACVLGVLADQVVADPSLLAAGALVSLGVWAIVWRGGRDRLAAPVLLTAAACVAGLWSGSAWRAFSSDDLGRYAQREPTPVALRAVVVGPVRSYASPPPNPYRAIPAEPRCVVELAATALRDGAGWRPAAGRCRLSVGGDALGVAPGDRVVVFGQLRRPKPALNPGEDDAAVRARHDRRLASLWTSGAEAVRVIDRGGSASVGVLRGYSQRAFDTYLSPPSAAIARAMVLGDSARVPQDVLDAFRRTGTLHALVVSGLHVGIVAMVGPLLVGFGVLPRTIALTLGLLLAGGYVLVSGANPPALRAGAIVVAATLAGLGRRDGLTINALAAAAIGVFAIAPGAWFGVGTQLSFLAAATLLSFGRGWQAWRRRERSPLDRLIERTRPFSRRLVRRVGLTCAGAVLATAAVMVVIGPLIAERFHLLSPGSLVLAPLLAFALPVAVLSGLVLALVAPLAAVLPDAVGAGLGVSSGAPCDFACWLLRTAVGVLDETRGAWFVSPGFGEWRLAVGYGWLAIAAVVAIYRPTAVPIVARVGLACLATCLAPLVVGAARGEQAALRVEFLAVGHGCATLVQTDAGGAYLIDAGALGEPGHVADTVARVLWRRGVTRLDGVLLSHADVDHYNALPGLLDRFVVDEVWCSHAMFDRVEGPDDLSAPACLQRRLTASGVPVKRLERGDRLRLGRSAASIVVLHPTDLGVLGSDNANSLVLGLEYAARRVLLPGDLESPGLEQVLAQEPYDCDVLLAPHHGSARSNPPGFARWSRPETVVISSGRAAEDAAEAFSAAGAKVLSTHDRGAIAVRIDAGGVALGSFRPPDAG